MCVIRRYDSIHPHIVLRSPPPLSLLFEDLLSLQAAAPHPARASPHARMHARTLRIAAYMPRHTQHSHTRATHTRATHTHTHALIHTHALKHSHTPAHTSTRPNTHAPKHAREPTLARTHTCPYTHALARFG